MSDHVPAQDTRETFVPREVVEEMLRSASADPEPAADLREAVGDTIDRL
jgi:hypothetical protein